MLKSVNVPAGMPVIRAAAKVTGTTVNRGYNVASVTRTTTGVYRVDFTDALPSADYFVSCIAAASDLVCRLSVYNASSIQVYFFNLAGAATDPTGFNIVVSR